MKVTVLGSGSAYGCPMVFNKWRNANPSNPKNIRSRASVLIETQGKYFLIDAGPEFRQQINDNNIPDINAVFITHGHYDHIAGIPELPRASKNIGHPIEIWASQETMNELKSTFYYLFNGEEPEGVGLQWKILPNDGVFESCGVRFETFQVPHHSLRCSAFRCEDFAYVADWQDLPEQALGHLQDLDVLLIECNNGLYPEVNGHGDLEKIKHFTSIIKPQKTILTHLSARVDFEETKQELPTSFELAFDGMIVNV